MKFPPGGIESYRTVSRPLCMAYGPVTGKTVLTCVTPGTPSIWGVPRCSRPDGKAASVAAPLPVYLCSDKRLTVPVHRGFDFQVVLDEYFDIVAFIHLNQWARLLAVDEVHLSLESICMVVRSLIRADE